MNIKELYLMMERTGMVDVEDPEEGFEDFKKNILPDPLALMSFIDDIFIYNDETTLKKFFMALLIKSLVEDK